MNREEKNQITRGKILSSAMTEFAAHGYEAASLNTVCAAGGISKGIIYHYFKDKDDLYLTCASIVFDELAEELGRTAGGSIDAYFAARSAWFGKNPDKAAMFCEALLFYPIQLQEQMEACRKKYDEVNVAVLRAVLADQTVRSGYQEADVQRIFRAFQNFLNAEYRNSLIKHDEKAILQHDADCRKALQIFLYGIIEEKR